MDAAEYPTTLTIGFFSGSDFVMPMLETLAKSNKNTLPYQVKLSAIGTKPPYTHRSKTHTNNLYQFAQEHTILLITPDSFRGMRSELEPILAKLDMIIVASYGHIIPQWALDAPRFGWINWHPSLLPRYRGPAPVQYTLLDDQPSTALTWIAMNAGMDTGDILLQKPFAISPNDTFDSIIDTAMTLGCDTIFEAIDLQIQTKLGSFVATVQDESAATYTHFITKDAGLIDIGTTTASALKNAVRAYVHFPTVRVYITQYPGLTRIDEVGNCLPANANEIVGTLVQKNAKSYLVCAEHTLLNLKKITLWDGQQLTL